MKSNIEMYILAVFVLMYASTYAGITYPSGSEFIAMIIAAPCFAIGASEAKKAGLDQVWLRLVNDENAKYLFLLVAFFLFNFIVGIATTKVTNEESGEFFVRLRDMSYVGISKEEYQGYLRADFRFFFFSWVTL